LRAKPLSISDVLRQPSFELAKQRFRASRVVTEPGEPSNKFELLGYTFSTIDNMPFGAVQLVTYQSSLHSAERYQPVAAADCRKSSPEGVGHGPGEKHVRKTSRSASLQ
jgi:hypothetical protein